MSEPSYSVADVGDLLTFAIGSLAVPRTGVRGRSARGGARLREAGREITTGSTGQSRRMGLRRGTSATGWYDAACRLEAVDRAAAIAAYERAIAGRPDLAAAHNNLGRLHHDAGAASVAESCYRLALCAERSGPEAGPLGSRTRGPSIALYWFNLGVAVEDQGRHAEAIAAYEHAIELDPQAADAHFNLARLLELTARRSGDELLLQRAVRHLLRYRTLRPHEAGPRGSMTRWR